MLNDKNIEKNEENLIHDEDEPVEEYNKLAVTQKEENPKNDKILIEWENINYTIYNANKRQKKSVETHNNYENADENNLSDPETLASFKIKDDKEIERKILTRMTGFALPSEILAILGPSGCGKTSLLNIIASRQLSTDKNHVISRRVLANDIDLTSNNFGKFCAYIMQDDILLETLTPRECLYFGARLRLRKSDDKIKRRVSTLIRQVIIL